MATQAQIEANRLNAQKSTGPRTPDGKAAIRENAVRHGLTSAIPLTEREANDQADVQRLHDAFIEENQPVGINEEVLVYQMAEYFLFQRHASAILGDQFNLADGAGNNNREIALMLRYHTTAVRGFSKALNDLRKLQKERKLQEIGFVSQELEKGSAAAPRPQPPSPPQMKPVACTLTRPGRQFASNPPAARPADTRKNTEKTIDEASRTRPQRLAQNAQIQGPIATRTVSLPERCIPNQSWSSSRCLAKLHGRLLSLMEEHGFRQRDLLGVFGSRGIASEVVSGEARHQQGDQAMELAATCSTFRQLFL